MSDADAAVVPVLEANPPVLLLPGWQDSGAAHWQSLWEKAHGYRRVEQHDWMRPLRGDWIARLEDMLLSCATASRSAVLVAHSLGCIMVAAWAAHTHNPQLVRAALLVAPGDVERPDVHELLPTWSPIVLRPLPFPSLLLASRDDPYCEFERTRSFGRAWGSTLVDCGACGHINADSGLGDWPQGHAMLLQLIDGS
jgi:predicted alpha/beta hydrolase family esterase